MSLRDLGANSSLRAGALVLALLQFSGTSCASDFERNNAKGDGDTPNTAPQVPGSALSNEFGVEPLPGEQGFDPSRFKIDWKQFIPSDDAQIDLVLSHAAPRLITYEDAKQLKDRAPSDRKDFELAVLYILTETDQGQKSIEWANQSLERMILSPLASSGTLSDSTRQEFELSPLRDKTDLVTLALMPDRNLRLLRLGRDFEVLARLMVGADSRFLAGVTPETRARLNDLPGEEQISIALAADNIRAERMRAGDRESEITKAVSELVASRVK